MPLLGLKASLCLAVWILVIVKETLSMRCDKEGICRCSLTLHGNLIADCSNLGLSVVPHFNPGVTRINLSHNQISSFPSSNKLPTNVSELDISFNSVTSLGNKSFWIYPELICLNLDGNRLDYSKDILKPNIFINLKNLKVLKLKLNTKKDRQESIYPEAITDVTSLEALYLDGLRGVFFTSSFGRLKKLQTIDVSGLHGSGKCDIEYLTSEYFINLPYLVSVNFAGCNLQTIEKDTFSLLPLMQYLNLSNNMRLTFKDLANVSNDLQYTNISSLDLSKIHCTYGVGTSLYIEDVKHLRNTSLSKLYLDSNRLTMMESGVPYYFPDTLEYISFNDNNPTFGLYILQFGALKNMKYFIGNGEAAAHNPANVGNLFVECKDWRGPPSSNVTITATSLKELLEIQTEAMSYTHFNDFQINRSLNMSQMEQQNITLLQQQYDRNTSLGRKIKNDKTSLWKNTVFSYNVSNRCNTYGIEFIINLPQNLEYFSFANNELKFKEIPCLHVSKLNKLKILNFSGNGLQQWSGPIFNLFNLEEINLSNNFCLNISDHFFDGGPNIKTLNIENNLLGFLFKYGGSKIFRNLKQLQEINLSNNKIETIPCDLFIYQYNLQMLNLSFNKMYSLNFRMDQMSHLQMLDLSNNELSHLDKNMRNNISYVTMNGSLSIDLTGNRLQCTCETLEFLRWVLKYQKHFLNFKQYVCYLQNGTTIRFEALDNAFRQLSLTCKSLLGLILAVVVAIAMCISFIICGLVYRFRWKLRYLYYMTKHKYQDKTKRHRSVDDQNSYHYDAFVSYAEEDSDFVRNEISEQLETGRGFNLCLHQRDFIPGRDIRGNITNCINESRKFVVVLTGNYLKSDWCMFEFNMARMESIYSRDGANMILVVFLEKIPARALPLDILALIESKSYAEYLSDHETNMLFWQNLSDALYH